MRLRKGGCEREPGAKKRLRTYLRTRRVDRGSTGRGQLTLEAIQWGAPECRTTFGDGANGMYIYSSQQWNEFICLTE